MWKIWEILTTAPGPVGENGVDGIIPPRHIRLFPWLFRGSWRERARYWEAEAKRAGLHGLDLYAEIEGPSRKLAAMGATIEAKPHPPTQWWNGRSIDATEAVKELIRMEDRAQRAERALNRLMDEWMKAMIAAPAGATGGDVVMPVVTESFRDIRSSTDDAGLGDGDGR